MKTVVRLFIAFSVVFCTTAYLYYDAFTTQITLGIDQSTEETMVDTANLVAELIADDVREQRLTRLEEAVGRYRQRDLMVTIFDVVKVETSFRIYVTDDRGIVIFDSSGADTGKDFSRWNDVYLTLKGEYGARATRADPDDEATSVIHIAAPIVIDDRIAGVVTVAKSKLSLRPHLDSLTGSLALTGIALFVTTLALCLLLSMWFTRSINRLTAYADTVVVDGSTEPPETSEPELRKLGEAMRAMRVKLDGKEYIEDFVQSLSHEIKSPVAAIEGALENMRQRPTIASGRVLSPTSNTRTRA